MDETKFYHTFNKEEFKRWLDTQGDKTLRLNYNLGQESLVVDAGGFKGEWSEKIYNLYECNILVFEPMKKYFSLIENKFEGNTKVKVYKKGLSNFNSVMDIYDSGDSSSVYLESEKSESVELIKFSEFCQKEGIEYIDLIKINIEGGEYDLMDDIISSGLVEDIKNIQVQFHRFIEGCHEKRQHIQNQLSKTHKLTYNFDFIWENWEKI